MSPERALATAVPGVTALGIAAAHDRFDQTEIAVASPIEHRQMLVLGVDEEEEFVAELLHLGECIFLEHRLDREALDLHDAAFPPGLGRPVREAPQELLLLNGAVTQARLLLPVDGLPLDPIDDHV